MLSTLFLICIIAKILFTLYQGYKMLEDKSIIRYVRQEERHMIVLATVTAYTSSVEETDDEPLITASGEMVRHGTLACPSKYKFGTVVSINGKEFICEDRMNKRFRHTERFDIWFESKSDALAWGKKELKIKVYNN